MHSIGRRTRQLSAVCVNMLTKEKVVGDIVVFLCCLLEFTQPVFFFFGCILFSIFGSENGVIFSSSIFVTHAIILETRAVNNGKWEVRVGMWDIIWCTE